MDNVLSVVMANICQVTVMCILSATIVAADIIVQLCTIALTDPHRVWRDEVNQQQKSIRADEHLKGTYFTG